MKRVLSEVKGEKRMRYTPEFDSTNGICIIRVTGEYQRPQDSDIMKHIAIDIFTKQGYRLFLIDLTQAKVMSSTMSTFFAANPKGELAEKLRKIRTAFVRRELTADDHFYENVAINRGFQLHAFDTLDKAVEWLKQTAAST